MPKQELNHYLSLLDSFELEGLMQKANEIRKSETNVITYSKKVFIPLTELCRDVCHYCTFAKTPKKLGSPYLEPDQVLSIAEQGKSQYVKEALFTLGEKPEMRYETARNLAVLKGNIAEDGCIVKTAGVDEKILTFSGPARGF